MIRLTGMASGLDTESMIHDLMSAYNIKKNKKSSAMTKYSWKMDTWSSLNKKISSFYSSSLNSLRFSTAYKSKKTTVSDATKASVVATNSAVTGTQTLAIKQLAQSGYLTGGKLSTNDDTTLSENTKLSSLGFNESGTGTFEVNGTSISVTKDSTISDVVDKLNNAGVNASYDATNKRIFVAAKNSGVDGDFNISASNTDGIKALANLGLYTGVSASAASGNAKYASYLEKDADGNFHLNSKADSEVSKLADSKSTAYKEKANAAQAALDANTIYQDAVSAATAAGTDIDTYIASQQSDIASQLGTIETDIKAIEDKAEADRTDSEKTQLEDLKKRQSELTEKKDSLTKATADIAERDKNQNLADPANCSAEAQAEILSKAVAAYNQSDNATVQSYIAGTASATAVRIDGQDAKIYLNGAEFSSSKNSFDVNGLTINCTAVTGLTDAGKAKAEADRTAEDYNTVTLSTDIDTDGIYNSVKDFINKYNALIKELDTMYNADAAKDYDVLTDEQKDSMSETEVTAWEKKIKDSLLRRDSDLNTIINTLKTGMQSNFDINGKNYSLASFGIETLSYFLAEDNEKGIYHIDGDKDDSSTATHDDKLKAAIASDPEAVQNFFMKLTSNIYNTMTGLSSTSTSRSFGNFYNDKDMKTQYASYKSALSDYEAKLTKIEDKYYKQFSKMESAMTKLQSSTSSLTSMFGGM